MNQLDFWFECGSTYWYPAAMRIEKVTRSAGVELGWRPFLLGPIFKAQRNDSPFNIYPAKGRYMWRDLERICGSLRYEIRDKGRRLRKVRETRRHALSQPTSFEKIDADG